MTRRLALLVALVLSVAGLATHRAYRASCIPVCSEWPRQVMPVGGANGFCLCVSTPDR